MRTVRVTGKGHKQIMPDMTRITMFLEGIYPEYADTLRHSSQATEEIKEILCGLDFARSDLKTLSFNIDTEYESYTHEGVYKERLVGYKYEHHLKVEFETDQKRLRRILYELSRSKINPEFHISFTVKDQEQAKNELLSKAVFDAQKKAVVLAQATGITLKSIQSIDYSWGEIDFEIKPMSRPMLAKGYGSINSLDDYNLDIEADNLNVSDTVTVIWEIE